MNSKLTQCRDFTALEDFKMARVIPRSFDFAFKVEFEANIRGHHVYKDVWTPTLGEKLMCKVDSREEAKEYDENAIGVYKAKKGGEEKQEELLVGHIPIELSKLIRQYIEADNSNIVIANVVGKRKRELGLVVPAKFKCFTMNQKLSKILHEEIVKKKTKFSYLELSVEDFIDKKRIEFK